ncbi:MAG TPA: tetratricopeptide repeat protein [Polyangiaceae bacterium]
MSDPERLVDGHADPLVRSLFAAAADEEPPAELAARVLAPLGAGLATIAAANASSLPPAAGTGAGATGAGTSGSLAASSLPAGFAGTTFAAVLKWVGIASIATAAGVGTVAAVSSRPDGLSEAASLLRAPAGSLVPSPSETLAGTEDTAPSVSIDELPVAASSHARPSSSTRDVSRLRLGEEAALIDEARSAIANGNASAALRTLETYRRRYPRPLLAPEALYLEMRAQELGGNHAAARKLAARLLAAYPNGVHAARARALLEDRER